MIGSLLIDLGKAKQGKEMCLTVTEKSALMVTLAFDTCTGVLVFNTPIKFISLTRYIEAVRSVMMKETIVAEENHRPSASKLPIFLTLGSVLIGI